MQPDRSNITAAPAAAPTAAPAPVFASDGRRIGTCRSGAQARDGLLLLIEREERLGGGTIAVPAKEAGEPERDGWHLPYGELSIREAPPYSPNVDLNAYLLFWERLGAANYNLAADEYTPTGSGPVDSERTVPDGQIRAAVESALREGLDYHLIQVDVHNGTVLLQGYERDTPRRLQAAQAAASVPGVKEVINMLVIRPL
jgi:hypothetical protein